MPNQPIQTLEQPGSVVVSAHRAASEVMARASRRVSVQRVSVQLGSAGNGAGSVAIVSQWSLADQRQQLERGLGLVLWFVLATVLLLVAS